MCIFDQLQSIPDHRHNMNKKHDLIDVIFLTFAAVLSGAAGWKSIQTFGESQLSWLRQHREFANGIPRRHCIANIIKSIDNELLLQALIAWSNQRRTQAGQSIIAIDGKILRKSWDKNIHKALHIVSAYDVENGITLYQESGANKGAEQVVARHIIDNLAAKGAMVTLDALHCQKETMALLRKKRMDFVIGLKSNQPTLLAHAQALFNQQYDNPSLASSVSENEGHGRQEQRTVMQVKANLRGELKKQWPQIKSFIEVASERVVNSKASCEYRWYASSLEVDAEQAAHVVRRHWSIENELHWVLDVVFKEDDLKLKDPDGAKQIGLFNRMALSVLRQHEGLQDSMAGKRHRAGWSGDFWTELLFGVK